MDLNQKVFQIEASAILISIIRYHYNIYEWLIDYQPARGRNAHNILQSHKMLRAYIERKCFRHSGIQFIELDVQHME